MSMKKVISYRTIWMGVAMLWIIFFHTDLKLPKLLSFIKSNGYGGVDIFIFSSGVGNYYSYTRNEEPMQFLQRRLGKLAPIYIPFMIFWCLVKVLTDKLSVIDVPRNLFGMQGFSAKGNFNWYVTGILLCYLLTPYLASFVKRNSLKKSIFLVLALIAVSTAFVNDTDLIIMVTRLPIYVIGMMVAKNENVDAKKIQTPLFLMFIVGTIVLVLVKLMLVKYLWNYGLHWYPFILIVPFLCLVISEISDFGERHKVSSIINRCFEIIGGITFEIYLVHIFIFGEFKYFFSNSAYNNNTMWCLLILLSILCAGMYSFIVKKVIYLFQKNPSVGGTMLFK